MKPRYLAIAVFVVILGATAVTDFFARDAYSSTIRSEVAAEADAAARDISDVIARETSGVDTLAAFVEITDGSLTDMTDQFPVFAEALLEAGETIRSVQLAPDAVIQFVYPMEGNEAAHGLDLLADPDREALLRPAIENGTTVIQGPVELVQGGLGILVRRPLYADDGEFWGFAAILLDWPSVADLTDLEQMGGQLIAGARLPEMGAVIAGNEQAFEDDPVIRTLEVGATDTIWEIAVRPASGWPTIANATVYIWVAGLVVATVAAMAAFMLAVRPEVARKEREKALRELALAEARYEATFRQAGVGILITNTEGLIVSANPAINRLLDWPDDSNLEGMASQDLVHPEDREWSHEAMRQLLAGKGSVQVETRTNSQTERWCHTNTTIIDGGDQGILFVSIIEDITTRRNAELALHESEAKFRQLFEQAPIAIQREDYSDVLRLFEGLRIEGVTDLRDYFESRPGALQETLELVRIIDANPAARELQGHLESSDGQLNLLDRMTEPTHSTFIETLVGIWDGRSSLEQSVETIGRNGMPQYLDVRWSAPVTPTGADYSNMMVTIADISELREVQVRLEDLIESKDRFLASVAHELRTPLTAVVGFAQELKDDLQLYGDSEKEEFRDLIAFHSSELSHIIEDLLVWARGDIGEVKVNPRPIDLGDGVRQTLRSIKNVDVEVVEPDGAVQAFADPTRLRQIIRNLATNAMRYGGNDVAVHIRTENGTAVIEVRDNGPKLGKADMSRIFEPYTRSRTATVAPGSIGLGLTVSRSLARLQGGDLVCVREGSENVFRVSLPIDQEQLLIDAG